ncbi:MAG: hypothetical protein ACI4SF_08000 [Oscillospiraceae bacterium]
MIYSSTALTASENDIRLILSIPFICAIAVPQDVSIISSGTSFEIFPNACELAARYKTKVRNPGEYPSSAQDGSSMIIP